MQVIYKCNVCNGENTLDVLKTEFKNKVEIIQGEHYHLHKCTVTFICKDCGAVGEDEFMKLNPFSINLENTKQYSEV